MDRQIKLDGHRIEPGEIEIALMDYPPVSQAHVTLIRDARGRSRLAAWVVGDAGEADLKAHLLHELPRYMVPGEFVFVESMPLTTNGKVDAARLPDPFASSGAEVQSGKTGENETLEQVIASIWRAVITGLEDLAVTDNFFDAGGSSLDMLRVKERLDAKLGREVPVVALFEFPTIAKLAAWLDAADEEPSRKTRAEARADHRRRALGRRRRS